METLLIVVVVLLTIIMLVQYFNISTLKRENGKSVIEYTQIKNTLEAIKHTNINPNEYVHRTIYDSVIAEKELEVRHISELYGILQESDSTLRDLYNKEISCRKSKEVRLGQIAEQIIPFLEHFNHNPKSLRALFSPIDYVAFEEDQITFIEVKTGNSQLSKKQKGIKKLIEEGKVAFEIHRINENDYDIK